MKRRVEIVVNEPVLLVDMDGTTYDFDTPMQADLARIAAPDDPPYVPDQDQHDPHMDARVAVVMAKPGFFLNLKTLPLGMRLLHDGLDLGFRVSVLSRGPRDYWLGWGEKVAACRRDMPRKVEVQIVDKKDLTFGDVLIDDFPKYFGPWLEAHPEGWVIMPDHPWNKDYEHPRVLRVRADSPEDLQAAALLMTRIATGVEVTPEKKEATKEATS